MPPNEYQARLQKLQELQNMGINPYANKYKKTHSTKESLKLGEEDLRTIEEIDNKPKEEIKIAGRLMSFRSHGKLSFGQIQDTTGKIQVCFMRDVLGEDSYKILKKIDVADFLGISGELFKTKHNETTILVKEYTLLSKTLRPLPEKWHGLQDQETKYRKRYLDLIMNPEVKNRFELRSKFIRSLREFYWKEGFMEIEIPVLCGEASGALAKPFVTHHNALDQDFFLRIALETPQKEAIAGGFEKTFEIGKVFRNEGMDPSHLQEFTMVEHYAAYWDYEDNMKFTEKMFEHLLNQTIGTLKVNIKDRDGETHEIDFAGPWTRKSIQDLIKEDCGIDISPHKTAESLLKEIKLKNIEIEDAEKLGLGNLVDHLYKKVSRPKLIQPTFLISHPTELSPLARRNDQDPSITDRFQLVINGWEIVNAYSELINPVEQSEAFESQSKAQEKGDEDAHGKDDEFILAMEHGMPCMSGWGMGVDRILALLTGQDNLKDVVMFPLMKPLSSHVLEPSTSLESEILKSRPLSSGPSLSSFSEPGHEVSTLSKVSISDPGITIKEANTLVNEHIQNPGTKTHMREAEVVLRALAKHLNQNEEAFGIAGLLHDLDWGQEEVQNNYALHGMNSSKILSEKGVNQDIIHAIQSHNYQYNETEPKSDLDFALICGEQITGLIYATAMVYPDKKLSSVKVKSLVKRMKKKDFAKNVDRDRIRDCEKLGLSLDEFLGIALKAMQEISEEIGL